MSEPSSNEKVDLMVPLPDGATRVNLPSGHHVILSDPKTLSARRKRPMKILLQVFGAKRFMEFVESAVEPTDRADPEAVAAAAEASQANVDALEPTETELGLMFRMSDAILYGLVGEWSVAAELPSEPAGFPDLLEDDDYEVLVACASQLQAKHMAEEGFVLDVSKPADPQSPTSASDPLSSGSEAVPAIPISGL